MESNSNSSETIELSESERQNIKARLFVGCLPQQVGLDGNLEWITDVLQATERNLLDVFTALELDIHPLRANVIRDHETDESKRFGFIQFLTQKEVEAVLQHAKVSLTFINSHHLSFTTGYADPSTWEGHQCFTSFEENRMFFKLKKPTHIIA